MKKVSLLLLSCGLSLSALQVHAAPATGDFIADTRCEMFQSKRKMTNPGDVMSKINTRYRILNTDSADSENIHWVQVHTAEAQDRWVKASCGHIENLTISQAKTSRGLSHAPLSADCHEPGLFDSHVLAVSWQPAFCETKSSKPECKKLTPESAAASSFTLHGLWPNKTSCGFAYGTCGSFTESPKDFCDYPALENLSADIRTQLGEVMPSEKYGSCLQRHEWWKHGTCSGLTQDGYYTRAIDLINQINASDFVSQFISENVGQKVSTDDMKTAFEDSFGEGTFNNVRLRCTKHQSAGQQESLLTELQIVLPKELGSDPDFATLINQDKEDQGSSNCQTSFLIDPVN